MRIQYVKYSTLRAKEYRICTQVVERADGCVVRKSAVTPEALLHVAGMAKNARRIREQAALFEVPQCTVVGGVFEMPYVQGEAMDRLLVEAALFSDMQGVYRVLDQYKRLVLAQPQTETDPGTHPAFREWFGESAGKTVCLVLGQVDLVLENLIRTPEGRYVHIDYEWLCDCPVPVHYVFHRAVRILYLHHRCVLEPVVSREQMLGRLGVDPSECEMFGEWDRRMDERIQGSPAMLPVPAAYMRSPSTGIVTAPAKLYYDTGDGFSENRCVQASACGTRLRFELPAISSVRRLRYDPCEGAYCVAQIKEAWAESENGRSPLRCTGSNAALTEGNLHFFTTQDPQLYFDAPNTAVQAVEIVGCVRAPDDDQLKISLEAQNEKTQALQKRLQDMERSVVRRMAGPLWGSGKTFKTAAKSVLRTLKLKKLLQPAAHIDHLGGHRYRASANDPYFIIPYEYRPGILRVDWAGDADFILPLRLYYDTGEGFTENGFWEIGTLGTEERRGHCFVRLQKAAMQLRLDPGEGTGDFTLTAFSLSRPSARAVNDAAIKAYSAWHGVTRKQAETAVSKDAEDALLTLVAQGCPEIHDPKRAYKNWIRFVEGKDAARGARPDKPVCISVVVPVYETDETMLTEMIESVRAQTYENWQLCLADGGSRKPHVQEILQKYAQADARIVATFLPENKGIAGNSNAALALAGGDYVALLDHDDVLAPDALSEVARAIEAHDGPDLLYSDEDKVTPDAKTRFMPHFKPEWDAELLRSCNYITHLFVAKRALLEAAGGFREGFDGSQDHDLILRLSETAQRIVHIPRVLYHWRSHAQSTAQDQGSKDYAAKARCLAVREHCRRVGLTAQVESDARYGILRVRYAVKDRPFVSIIMQDAAQTQAVLRSAEAVTRTTEWSGCEIIVAGAGVQEETFAGYGCVRAVPCGRQEKAAEKLRAGVAAAKGDMLVLLRPGIEPQAPDWIVALYELAQREETGAVGCLMRYPNGALLHAGIILGFEGGSGYVGNRHPADDPGYMARVLCTREVSAVSAACMMIKKPLLQNILGTAGAPGMDWGETALCNAVRKAGKRIYYTPHAECVWHDAPAQLPRQGTGGGDSDPFYSPHFVLQAEPYRIREE